jgi:transcriptional regulator with XRE-family HTH domain
MTMSFDDAAAKLKKLSAKKEQEKAAEQKPVDLHELYTLRARMLGVLIRDARVAAGYRVEDLAAEISVAPETVIDWEFGRSVPSLPQLELAAYILQVPVSHFWGTETLEQQHTQRTIDGYEYVMLRDHMIGAIIRSTREANGSSLEAVADQIGVEPSLLEAYELGNQPVPMTILVSLSSALSVNLDYFLERNGRVGEFFEVQKSMKIFEMMSDDVREFVSSPANQAYIKVAMSLSTMPTDDLRKFAEGLLDITL